MSNGPLFFGAMSHTHLTLHSVIFHSSSINHCSVHTYPYKHHNACMCMFLGGANAKRRQTESEPMNGKISQSLILICLHCPHLPSIDSVLRSALVLRKYPTNWFVLTMSVDKVFLDQFYSWTLCACHLAHAHAFTCPVFPLQKPGQNCIC